MRRARSVLARLPGWVRDTAGLRQIAHQAAKLCKINEMPASVFDSMKEFIGFGEQDASHLRALAEPLAPHFPAIAERFYREIQRSADAREVLRGGPNQVEALRRSVLHWLRGLFSGRYDADYARERVQIGRTHVQIGMPLHLLMVGLEVVRAELGRAIAALPGPGRAAQLASLHKLLGLETGLIVTSYQESFIGRVRQVERDAMQARLREAEQLAQIGQLAASLAHEIKNPLAGISGAIQVIRANLRETNPHWPVLGEVLRQINRLDRTVKDLLVYARPKPPRYQRCDLRRGVTRVLALLSKEPEFERIRFESDLPRDLPLLPADENQLEQVIMNLLLNAAQASAPGDRVRLTAQSNGETLRLAVEDHGCGMTDEVARRALEPFFTTKARGTGLGLPICRKIVEAHGGTLDIRTASGAGTEVTLELPLRPPTAAAAADYEIPTPT
ncbi:MAG: protoglobin domain-containing protein [Planctomycetota bacterium]